MLGLFSRELIFGGAYYWKEFCVSKWVGLDNKTASTNSPWAYIREGLLSEGFLRLRFGGLIFGRANFRGGGDGGAYYRNFTVFHSLGSPLCTQECKSYYFFNCEIVTLISSFSKIC